MARRRRSVRQPRGETAYRAIKAAIIGNELKPGALISEEAWAQKTGVSRTPVREALNRLEQEKLVRRVPNRGIFVAELSVQDFLSICEVRSLLESNACRIAAQRVQAADLDRFEAEFRHLAAKQPTEHDLRHANEIDRAFHTFILEHAGNQQVVAIISNLNDMITRLRYALTPSRYHESLEEHQQILTALRARDGEAAAAAMRGHINRVSQSLHRINLPASVETALTAISPVHSAQGRGNPRDVASDSLPADPSQSLHLAER